MKLNVKATNSSSSLVKTRSLSLISYDFGRVQPIKVKECLPRDVVHRCHIHGSVRTVPQTFPPYGRCSVKTAAYFVPVGQLINDENAFFSGMKFNKGYQTGLPWFNNIGLNIYLAQSGYATYIDSSPATAAALNDFDSYDFTWYSGSGDREGLYRMRLTRKGRSLYAILKACGYDFAFFSQRIAGETPSQYLTRHTVQYNALPILAYVKVFSEIFLTGPQYNDSPATQFLNAIYLNRDYSYNGTQIYTASTREINHINVVFDYLLRVPLESNLYTTAWNSPESPLGVDPTLSKTRFSERSTVSVFGGQDHGEIGSIEQTINRLLHGTPTAGGGVKFSALGHRTLTAFDKMLKKMNLYGSNAAMQVLGLFGIKTDEMSHNMVRRLAMSASPLTSQAIFSNTDNKSGSGGKALGEYAGASIGQIDLDYSFRCNDRGYLVNICWLNIDPVIMHGTHPDCLKRNPLDFYNGDMDGVGTRPIPTAELAGAKASYSVGKVPGAVAGFTNLYDEYRVDRDVVAGVFTEPIGKDFAFQMDYNIALRSDRLSPQSDMFRYYLGTGSNEEQFTDPFIVSAENGDRFFSGLSVDIDMTRPIKSSEASLAIDAGDITIAKNGDSGAC